jgi:hypothetical protein
VLVSPASGGTVRVNGNKLQPPYPAYLTVRDNSTVLFEAIPADGYGFDMWSGAFTGTNPVNTYYVTCDIQVTANFNQVNEPPTADAGTDQTVDEGVLVTLDGSNSSDPDDGIASYQWTQSDGPSVNLSNPASSTPSFTSPSAGVRGVTLTFELMVTDHLGLSSTDSVTITITAAVIADGDVAPLGSRDGIVNVGDALVALRFVLWLETPTLEDIQHADVAPFENGQPNPDGVLDIGDPLVILRKALGIISF